MCQQIAYSLVWTNSKNQNTLTTSEILATGCSTLYQQVGMCKTKVLTLCIFDTFFKLFSLYEKDLQFV